VGRGKAVQPPKWPKPQERPTASQPSAAPQRPIAGPAAAPSRPAIPISAPPASRSPRPAPVAENRSSGVARRPAPEPPPPTSAPGEHLESGGPSSSRPGSKRPAPRRASSSRGPMPRRGTSSARGEPLPRRGTSSSARGEPLPRRGTSSAGAAPSPATPPPTHAHHPPPAAATVTTTMRRGPGREEIDARLGALDDQTFFQILGLDESATIDTVQSTYFALAKVWHPDRLPNDLQDVKPHVARIFARMNEAFQTLSNPERRHEYMQAVRTGGGTARDRAMVERVVDSAMLFHKGEILFKRGQHAQAEILIKRAVDADPEQPEYRTMLAWIQCHRLGNPPDDEEQRAVFYQAQLDTLDAVIEKEPHFERALFYRAELLKRCGLLDRAMRDYRDVVRLNPRNIDAAREVRIYSMRAKKEEDKKGLFGKLFGGKPKP
jgi:DnaJ-domain-containing protein 1